MKHLKLLSFLCLMIMLLSGFEIIDPASSNPFLRQFNPCLDTKGIDIILDWKSKVKTQGNPVLAPIADYAVTVRPKKNKWMKEFANNYANAIVALKTDLTTEEFDFFKEWKKVPSTKKIFISFTQSDLKHAMKIKSCLEELEYKVFMYKEPGRALFTSPKLIAQCMREAENVFILDTENSRNMPGVMAEALTYAKYKYVPSSEIFAETDQIMESTHKEIVKNYDISEYNKEQLIEESIEFYKEVYDKEYTKDEIEGQLQNDYKISLTDIQKFEFNVNDKFYTSIKTNNQSKLKKSLTQNLAALKSYTLQSKSKFKNFLIMIDKLAICPYYKIPKAVCPKCR